jgi:hypothetical protein
MSPMPADVIELLRELIARTTAGAIRWEVVDDRGTSFVYNSTSGAVSIASRDQDGAHPFVFSLLTADGVVADNWSSVEIDTPAVTTELLEELYTAAKRSATGADTLVRDLLGEVRGKQA